MNAKITQISGQTEWKYHMSSFSLFSLHKINIYNVFFIGLVTSLLASRGLSPRWGWFCFKMSKRIFSYVDKYSRPILNFQNNCWEMSLVVYKILLDLNKRTHNLLNQILKRFCLNKKWNIYLFSKIILLAWGHRDVQPDPG